jgi:hypothetical protein
VFSFLLDSIFLLVNRNETLALALPLQREQMKHKPECKWCFKSKRQIAPGYILSVSHYYNYFIQKELIIFSLTDILIMAVVSFLQLDDSRKEMKHEATQKIRVREDKLPSQTWRPGTIQQSTEIRNRLSACTVAQVCNPSYSEGRGLENHSLRPRGEKSL